MGLRLALGGVKQVLRVLDICTCQACGGAHVLEISRCLRLPRRNCLASASHRKAVSMLKGSRILRAQHMAAPVT